MSKELLQRYKIEITRRGSGKWPVKGYWNTGPMDGVVPEWDLDGEPKEFQTRKEALEHCLNVTGVPE